ESKGKPIPLYILIIFELITSAVGISSYTDFNSALPIIISCLYTYGTWQKNLKVTYSIGTFVSVVWFFYKFVVGA
ncbi:MAG: YgjV family protein, partial [Bacilli bacterium]|nr:YgjV family protein [Bacilli bacterium]